MQTVDELLDGVTFAAPMDRALLVARLGGQSREWDSLRAAVAKLQAAWDRLGACVDEFAPDMEACAEYSDMLDSAILAVFAALAGE